MKNNYKNLEAVIHPSNLQDGEITVSGYKHASNLIIVAAILLPNVTFKLVNIPHVLDTTILLEILANLGAEINYIDNIIEINTTDLLNRRIDVDITQQVHGTLYLLPALLCRFGKVELGRCGGCPIGDLDNKGNSRPITHIIELLEQCGAVFEYQGDYISGTLEQMAIPDIIDIQDYSDESNELVGQLVSGATKTAILIAISTKNKTSIIKNPYVKADVRELLLFLQSIGIEVEQTENELQIINRSLKKEVTYKVMSDINEVFTYITLAVFHNIHLTLRNITVDKVKEAFIQECSVLQTMGIQLSWYDEQLVISKNSEVLSRDIDIGQAEKNTVYADHQPFFALLLSIGDKPASITDRVWKKRFQYASELQKIGFQMQESEEGTLNIVPGRNLNQTNQLLLGHDVRATALVIMAALKHESSMVVNGIHHLARGYSDFIGKLQSLGANIELTEAVTV